MALLIGLPPDLVADWLEPALEVAQAEELPGLAAAAVPAGAAALAPVIDRLEDAGADVDAILRTSSDLSEAAWRAVSRGMPSESGARLATLLAERPEPLSLTTLAVLAVEAAPAGPAAAAAISRWMATGGDRRVDARGLERLTAAWGTTHDPGLLLALAMAMGRGTHMVTPDEHSDPALRIALGSVLQRSRTAVGDEAISGRVLSWLAHGPLCRSAQRALGEARPPEILAAVFAAAHVVELAGVRRGLAGVSRPARGLPSPVHVAGLAARPARGLARYVARVPLTAAIRGRTLEWLAEHDDAAAAWRATRRLALDSVRREGARLGRIAMGGTGPAARVAVRRLRTAGGGSGFERLLAEHGSSGVARAARRRTPGHAGRREAGRTMAWRRAVQLDELARDRDAVLTQWREDLMGADPELRANTIATASRLGLVRPLADAIGVCALDPHPRVAAAACAALRWARDEQSTERLRRAVRTHEDPRVRSNALESLTRRGIVDPDLILAAARSSHARERSVAALALARFDERRASRLAAAMLMDARPEHRRSGTWTARRLRSPRLVPVLVEVVRRDTAPDVRERARAAVVAMVRGDAAGHASPAAEATAC